MTVKLLQATSVSVCLSLRQIQNTFWRLHFQKTDVVKGVSFLSVNLCLSSREKIHNFRSPPKKSSLSQFSKLCLFTRLIHSLKKPQKPQTHLKQSQGFTHHPGVISRAPSPPLDCLVGTLYQCIRTTLRIFLTVQHWHFSSHRQVLLSQLVGQWFTINLLLSPAEPFNYTPCSLMASLARLLRMDLYQCLMFYKYLTMLLHCNVDKLICSVQMYLL